MHPTEDAERLARTRNELEMPPCHPLFAFPTAVGFADHDYEREGEFMICRACGRPEGPG